MRNIADKLTDEQYERNFADIAPPMSLTTAMAEASCCLFCYDAPCSKACPTAIDVPSFIRKIYTGNVKGAARVILEANVLGASCARVCPVEVLCEGACVYNVRHEKPIQIGRLQRFATDYVAERRITILRPGVPNGRHVAIVGAGPAGLACAAELAMRGYRATVYEKRPLPGGLNTYGMAAYKMRTDVSLREVEMVKDLGVEIRTGVEIGNDIGFAALEEEYDAVFIGVGLGATQPLNVPGEDLEGVYDALQFIELIRMKPFRSVPVGRRVVVVGGGNTAIDAATQAKRLGAEEVALIYRRSELEMPAFAYEYQLAKKDGIHFCWLTTPIRILGEGEVAGLACMRTKLGELDASGRRRPEPIPNSEFILPADMVIKALGQVHLESLLSEVSGIQLKNGAVVVNEQSQQTGNPRYFAGGDCINGGKEVVDAVASGKRAARGIMTHLECKGHPGKLAAAKNRCHPESSI